MTEAEARARIERLTAHDHDPMLDTDDIDELVELAKRDDADGLAPDDLEWTPTWNIHFAAQSGWATKAARAAGDFRFEEDMQTFYREQVYRHCRAMADRYNRGMVAVPLVSESA